MTENLEMYNPTPGLEYSDRAWYRLTLHNATRGYSHEVRGSFPWTRKAGLYKEYWSVARAFLMESMFRQGFQWLPELSFKLELQQIPYDTESWTTVVYEWPSNPDNDEENDDE